MLTGECIFVINDKECSFYNTVWYEGGLQLADCVIAT